jgi:hypothetical protein
MKNVGLILIILLTFFTVCCKKKKGCVSPDAINYCSDCKENDGSCEFLCNFVIWFDSTLYKTLTNNNIDSIDVFVRDHHGFQKFIGSYSKNQVFQNAPDCSASNALKIDIKYVQSEMPDAGGSGGSLSGGGGKIWILTFYAKSKDSIGYYVSEKQFIVGAGTNGCHVIKL